MNKVRKSSRIVWMKKALEHDVVSRNKVMIPAGTKGVGIRFRASRLFRTLDDGSRERLNIYYYKSLVVHA